MIRVIGFENLESEVKKIIEIEKVELKRRVEKYRGPRSLPNVKNKMVILVDDGLATGVTAVAASRYLKLKGARKVILAIPVGPRVVSVSLKREVSEIICPYRLTSFTSIGQWYQKFNQVTDDEVQLILEQYHVQNHMISSSY